MTVRTLITTISTGCMFAGILAVNNTAPARADVSLPASRSAAKVLSGLPLHFEPNKGQTDREADYLSRGDGYTLFLTGDGPVIRLRKPAPEGCRPCGQAAGAEEPAPEYAAVRMRLTGADRAASVSGEEVLAGRSRYITPAPARFKPGSNRLVAAPAQEISAAHYGRVRYRAVYPGIDVVYYGNRRRLEYDFLVAPGADPKTIRLRFEGARAPRLDADGDLLLETTAGTLVQHAPVAYQERDGQRDEVPARYVISDGGEVTFGLGRYDRTRRLVIDPVLSYGTFLGGNADDEAWAVAVDKDGNILVAGDTESTDFPRQNPAFGTFGGSYDGFVTKISADGKTLIYSTYIGSTDAQGWDSVAGIAVDPDGNAVLTGRLSMDVLLAKLNPAGQSVFAIAFGGQSSDMAYDIALGADRTLFLTGMTLSKDYDGSEEYEGFPYWPMEAYQTARKSSGDAFVCRIDASDPNNLIFVYSTYLGGNSFLLDDEGRAIAADAAGNAYVAGITPSADFPTTESGRQRQSGGHLTDAFLAKISPDGTQLLYGTYMGGGFNEEAHGVAADNNGNAYVTGWTNSYDFPTTPNSFQPEYAIGDCDPSPTGTLPCADAFVVKVDTKQSGEASFAYSTFLGGHFSDYGYGITLDADGNAYVVGQTLPYDFPLVNELPDAGSGKDVFVAKLDPTGKNLLFSTTFGGADDDKGNAVALDTDRNIYVVGQTSSTTTFPRPGAVQADFGGGYRDAFVVKITAGGSVPVAGDVDGNGQFTIEDVKLSLRIAGGFGAATADQVSRGEAAAPSGALTLADVAALLRKL